MFSGSKAKVSWPKDQEEHARQLFGSFILKGRCPSKEDCEEVLDQFPHCNGNYRTLVMKINNLITRSKKLASKPVLDQL